MNSTGRQASPSANATGTRSTRKKKKAPNSHSAATAGLSAAPVIGEPPTARRRPNGCSYDTPGADLAARGAGGLPAGPLDDHAQVRAEPLEAEQQPGESRQRPGDEEE